MKYNNKKCSQIFRGREYHFDSKAERSHFIHLSKRLENNKISKLKLQPMFVVANAFKIDTTKTKSGKSKIGEMKYTPDFEYFEGDKRVVVEVKGMKTTSYTMRLKLFLAIAYKEYGIDTFIEVTKGITTTYDCRTVQGLK